VSTPGAHAAQDSMTNERLNWLALTPTFAAVRGVVFVLPAAWRRLTSRSASLPGRNPARVAFAASPSSHLF
jgi:hypothetical protein